MPVAVQMPNEKEKKDPLDTIIKGLGVATQIYGIKEASDKAKLLEATKQQELEAAKQKSAFEQTKFEHEKQKEVGDLFAKGVLVGQGADGKPAYKRDPTHRPDNGLSDMIKTLQLQALQKETSQGKTIPASEAVSFGGADAAYGALDEAKTMLAGNEDITGPLTGRFNSLKAKLEVDEDGKRYKTYDSELKAKAQAIGKYLEGGKLTDADIDRYKDMLPNGFDSAATAEKKAIILQNMIAQKQNSEMTSLQQAGYNTGGLLQLRKQQNPNLNTGLRVPGISDSKKGAIPGPLSSANAANIPQAPKGMITVSNGKETLHIQQADLTDAQRDGYQVIK